MCGISGIVSRQTQAPSLDLLRTVTRCMKHRGPDDEGFQQAGSAALGFQRLAIIDLETGHQPMSNEDDRYWIVFNGEIYNHRELRERLQATGRHRFKTQHSDTEVILHLYEEYGADCLSHLRGMFAFAIWDTQTRTLFAARDRFGKKPFFYFESPAGELVFASELKALHLHPDCPKEIDPSSIHLYLNLQYIPSPRTIYKGVRKLAAAHSLTWTPERGVKTHRYWDLRYEPRTTQTYSQAQERLRTLLKESVRLRMRSDVPLGAFLSGGLDSSIVVALMAQQSDKPIRTFCIGFQEEAYSELRYARQVAERYRTDHHEFVVKPQLADILPKLAWFYSEPFADASALPSYYVSQETKKHVTVALNGDGGDEMFAGYLRYRALWAMQYWNVLPSAIRKSLNAVGAALPADGHSIGPLRRIQRFLKVGSMAPTDQYLRTLDYFHEDELQELWTADHWRDIQSRRVSSAAMFADTLKQYQPEELVHQLMYLDLHYYLPDGLMVKMDIASMANSLEARSPFLDHVLAEEVARWPQNWKYQPPNHSKRILRETFAKDLPPAIQNRGKQGFGVPIAQWFREPLRGYLEETILSPKALQRGYFRPEVLRRYVQEHVSGKRDRSYGLWALLMLELWHQAYQTPRE